MSPSCYASSDSSIQYQDALSNVGRTHNDDHYSRDSRLEKSFGDLGHAPGVSNDLHHQDEDAHSERSNSPDGSHCLVARAIEVPSIFDETEYKGKSQSNAPESNENKSDSGMMSATMNGFKRKIAAARLLFDEVGRKSQTGLAKSGSQTLYDNAKSHGESQHGPPTKHSSNLGTRDDQAIPQAERSFFDYSGHTSDWRKKQRNNLEADLSPAQIASGKHAHEDEMWDLNTSKKRRGSVIPPLGKMSPIRECTSDDEDGPDVIGSWPKVSFDSRTSRRETPQKDDPVNYNSQRGSQDVPHKAPQCSQQVPPTVPHQQLPTVPSSSLRTKEDQAIPGRSLFDYGGHASDWRKKRRNHLTADLSPAQIASGKHAREEETFDPNASKKPRGRDFLSDDEDDSNIIHPRPNLSSDSGAPRQEITQENDPANCSPHCDFQRQSPTAPQYESSHVPRCGPPTAHTSNLGARDDQPIPGDSTSDDEDEANTIQPRPIISSSSNSGAPTQERPPENNPTKHHTHFPQQQPPTVLSSSLRTKEDEAIPGRSLFDYSGHASDWRKKRRNFLKEDLSPAQIASGKHAREEEICDPNDSKKPRGRGFAKVNEEEQGVIGSQTHHDSHEARHERTRGNNEDEFGRSDTSRTQPNISATDSQLERMGASRESFPKTSVENSSKTQPSFVQYRSIKAQGKQREITPDSLRKEIHLLDLAASGFFTDSSHTSNLGDTVSADEGVSASSRIRRSPPESQPNLTTDSQLERMGASRESFPKTSVENSSKTQPSFVQYRSIKAQGKQRKITPDSLCQENHLLVLSASEPLAYLFCTLPLDEPASSGENVPSSHTHRSQSNIPYGSRPGRNTETTPPPNNCHNYIYDDDVSSRNYSQQIVLVESQHKPPPLTIPTSRFRTKEDQVMTGSSLFDHAGHSRDWRRTRRRGRDLSPAQIASGKHAREDDPCDLNTSKKPRGNTIPAISNLVSYRLPAKSDEPHLNSFFFIQHESQISTPKKTVTWDDERPLNFNHSAQQDSDYRVPVSPSIADSRMSICTPPRTTSLSHTRQPNSSQSQSLASLHMQPATPSHQRTQFFSRDVHRKKTHDQRQTRFSTLQYAEKHHKNPHIPPPPVDKYQQDTDTPLPSDQQMAPSTSHLMETRQRSFSPMSWSNEAPGNLDHSLYELHQSTDCPRSSYMQEHRPRNVESNALPSYSHPSDQTDPTNNFVPTRRPSTMPVGPSILHPNHGNPTAVHEPLIPSRRPSNTEIRPSISHPYPEGPTDLHEPFGSTRRPSNTKLRRSISRPYPEDPRNPQEDSTRTHRLGSTRTRPSALRNTPADETNSDSRYMHIPGAPDTHCQPLSSQSYPTNPPNTQSRPSTSRTTGRHIERSQSPIAHSDGSNSNSRSMHIRGTSNAHHQPSSSRSYSTHPPNTQKRASTSRAAGRHRERSQSPIAHSDGSNSNSRSMHIRGTSNAHHQPYSTHPPNTQSRPSTSRAAGRHRERSQSPIAHSDGSNSNSRSMHIRGTSNAHHQPSSSQPPNTQSRPSTSRATGRHRERSLSPMANSDDSPQDINTRNANTCDTNDSDPENPHSDDPDSDPDSDPESDESISLAENVKYKNKRRCRNAKKTKDRHGELGREKASKPAILSQHEKLSVAIIDYVKLLLGITRKPRRAKITFVSSLPAPPSEEEIETWVQRRIESTVKIYKEVS
ncbi:uncharacterized protein MELLADRAFT_64466 [Melampsora larici-populina 98AG31]|uniref:Uncharacterized protein n=1 Tax=Melampsora larici-populina (strain 98AG31 / pathotype 3-4-7) TaxID=747676 RepID=F4RRJ9_MELLP|nr:uncharacterized protein MELLADRAFT_64466 [Melampsora larici-populina 98AG31]EGG05013.1 hypothetical protein MELLADRAFT_64466 [Melampsora larici-populina 98AG31]